MKMKQIQKIILGAVAFVILLFISGAIFIVPEREQVMVLQFGDHLRTVQTPGLHFKVPVIQNIVRYEKRLLDVQVSADEVILGDQKVLNADAYARFYIFDPLQFRRAVGDDRILSQRLGTIVESSLRQVLGNKKLTDVLSGERVEIMDEIKTKVSQQALTLGLDIIDVRIRRGDLPKEISENIYKRMISERQREAKEFRAQGAEQAQEIKSKADRERTIILAEANKQAQIVRGEGDAQAAKIYADAFGRDPKFYALYRSLQAYRATLSPDNTTYVLSPDSAYLKYFESLGGATQ